MAHEKKCMICGQIYRYCPRCDEFKGLPTWMTEFDSENCRSLYYDVINPFAFKHITKEEALNRLKNLDLSNTENAPADIKKVLDELLAVSAENKSIEESKPKKKPIFKSKED